MIAKIESLESAPDEGGLVKDDSSLSSFKARMERSNSLDSASTTMRPQGAIRRTRSPPRNPDGFIVCDHPECRNKNETFRRPCEWNKHMDRHERPYKCNESSCELNPGFTYSGGLLRHQREVHKMHLSTKQPFYCPYPNCNRNSGAGFTRRENLEEHKRRRHSHASTTGSDTNDQAQQQPLPTILPPTSPLQATSSIQAISPQHKRKRSDFSEETQQTSEVEDTADNAESRLVKYLRSEMLRKDELLRRQTVEIQRLQNLIRSLPPQTVYGIIPQVQHQHTHI